MLRNYIKPTQKHVEGRGSVDVRRAKSYCKKQVVEFRN